jgi:hypothetical protein
MQKMCNQESKYKHMKNNTFMDFLQDIHGKQYFGTDDCMPEDFNDWLESQDIQDIISWAERWGRSL